MSRLKRFFSIFVITVAHLSPICYGLSGLHVCQRIENYTVTSKEQYTEPVNIHTLEWCFAVPPRCASSRTELRERFRTKEEVKFRTVPVCCEGYAIQESDAGIASPDATCVPFCKKCYNGVCTAPNVCSCEAGYHGSECLDRCPKNHWGQNCTQTCACKDDKPCNHITGKCDCPPGLMGSKCNESCPPGTWGALDGCRPVCKCKNPSVKCHPDSGECMEDIKPKSPSGPVGGGAVDLYEGSGESENSISAPINSTINEFAEAIDFDREAELGKSQTNGDNNGVPPVQSEELIPISNTLATKKLQSKSPVSEESHIGRLTPKQAQHEHLEVEDRQETDFQLIVPPKTEYVKTANEAGASITSAPAISTNLAAVIVVGAILSVSLTSIAALMIFHVRSRLLKAAMSIYNHEKAAESQYASGMTVNAPESKDRNGGAPPPAIVLQLPTDDLMTSTLPRGTMLRNNPMYNNGAESAAILNIDDRNHDYANGTVTIGIRLSSNLRDLLESQYDRPPAYKTQKTPPPAAEHVYAEIPLITPLYTNFEEGT